MVLPASSITKDFMMSFIGTPAQMEARWKQRASQFKSGLYTCESALKKTTLDMAIRLSNGTYTYYDLASMDYPYAKRHGTALLPPYKLNAHDGTVLRGWKYSYASRSLSNFSTKLSNTSPWMVYLLDDDRSTSRMVQRPIHHFIAEAMRWPRVKEYRRMLFGVLS